jgi:outer membrane protein, adhesin transport system
MNTIKTRFWRWVGWSVLVVMHCSGTFASNPTSNFADAVRKSVLDNPRIATEWYRLEAAIASERAARGAMLPSVNLAADASREERQTPQTEFSPYSSNNSTFTINQMLFDGFRALELTKEKKFESYAQFFQLRDESEQVALDAAAAYLDVYRHQQLVEYSIDNLIEHREVFLRIKVRTMGGVDADVDFEQAQARLSLAESNLLVELNNLNDVKTGFQRVVGVSPADGLARPQRDFELPGSREIALRVAYQHSPVLDLNEQTSRARKAGVQANRGSFYPTLELRYRNQKDSNREGVRGNFEEEAIEVALNLNLYRGGTDLALTREAHNLYYSALEQQKVACINVRQDILNAYNEVQILKSRVDILKANLESQEKSKDAYKDQFSIGERTLLDMLDGVNEYFLTRNSVINAEVDLIKAEIRTLAVMGVLLATVGVEGRHSEELDKYRDRVMSDSEHFDASVCPFEVPQLADVDIDAIYAKTDAEFEAEDGAMFEGDGGFGGFEGDGGFGGFEGDGGFGESAVDDPFDLSDPFDAPTLPSEVLVYYGFDSAEIPMDFDAELENLAMRLSEDPEAKALIEGHADDSGARSYNNTLSLERAEAIKRRLVQQYAVDPDQIELIGFGEDRPLDTLPQEQPQNRRAVILIE